jgi:hypothetical protein
MYGIAAHYADGFTLLLFLVRGYHCTLAEEWGHYGRRCIVVRCGWVHACNWFDIVHVVRPISSLKVGAAMLSLSPCCCHLAEQTVVHWHDIHKKRSSMLCSHSPWTKSPTGCRMMPSRRPATWRPSRHIKVLEGGVAAFMVRLKDDVSLVHLPPTGWSPAQLL